MIPLILSSWEDDPSNAFDIIIYPFATSKLNDFTALFIVTVTPAFRA